MAQGWKPARDHVTAARTNEVGYRKKSRDKTKLTYLFNSA